MSNPEFTFYTTSISVEQLGIFVLKSGAETTVNGQAPETLDIGPAGPMVLNVPDRGLVAASVIDASHRQAHFISLRGWKENTEKIRYAGDAALAQVATDITSDGKVTVKLPQDYGEHMVDFNDLDVDKEMWSVQIHSGVLPAVDLGDDAAASFTNFLRDSNKDNRHNEPVRDVRLFAPHPAAMRLVRPEYRHAVASSVLNAADGAQLTIANSATLAQLERKEGLNPAQSAELGNKGRPRANIWLGGSIAPMAEDLIEALQFSNGAELAELVGLGACIRCVATGVHPVTAERGASFLGMLRSRRLLSKSTGDVGAIFAANFAPRLVNGKTARISKNSSVAVAWARSSNVEKPQPTRSRV